MSFYYTKKNEKCWLEAALKMKNHLLLMLSSFLVNDDIYYYEKIKSLLLMYTHTTRKKKHAHICHFDGGHITIADSCVYSYVYRTTAIGSFIICPKICMLLGKTTAMGTSLVNPLSYYTSPPPYVKKQLNLPN